MRTHATAQHIGSRPLQCDVTAVVAAPHGVRAYALLDGVGSTREVARWTRRAAHRVAALAARHRDAEAGLRAAYDHYAANPDPDLPCAAAVVAVTAPGKPLTVAWCGDSRAYLLRGGTVEQLTQDHNLRRTCGGPANILTSCLGARDTDDKTLRIYGHPTVEATSLRPGRCRLLLASDGAYEPLEASCVRLEDYLTGPVEDVPGGIVTEAVELGSLYPDNATALVADL